MSSAGKPSRASPGGAFDACRGEHGRALVVDGLESRRYLQALLSAHGWTVRTARDDEDALVQARSCPPDVVISDVPGTGGFTLLRSWKADPQLKCIPFVLYAARGLEPEDERLARELGADAFVRESAGAESILEQLEMVRAGAATDRHPEAATHDAAVLSRDECEALVRKLEKKSLQLEEMNRALQVDVAERMRVEVRLRLLDSAMTQSGEAVLITDARLDLPGPHIVFVNAAFLSMTGYTAAEVIGRTPRILQGPRTDRRLLARLRRCLERGEVFEGEAVNYRKDGSAYQQEWKIAPVSDGLGNTSHFVAILRDVTARRKTEDALRESEMRLDGIVSSAMDAIVSVDGDRNILLANPAAEAMFGYAAAEMKGNCVDMLMPARFHAGHAGQFRSFGQGAVASRRMSSPQAVMGRRKNGDEFEIEASISKDQSTGRQLFTAILRDITDRTQAEQRIRRLNRVRDVMAGINGLIVRVKSREELFHEACAIAIEKGEFGAAWIGIISDSRVSVPLSAWCGAATPEYRGQVEAVLADPASSLSPMASIANDLQPVVVNSIAHDPRVMLRDGALASGFRSLVVLPLCIGGTLVALFTLYSVQEDVFDEDEMKLLAQMSSDLSLALDHIQKTEKLDYLAYYDSLTGLANRSLFLDRLAQHMHSAAAGGRKLAVVLTDIERFRNVNETLGRHVGDALLKHVAGWMTRTIGDANLLARIEADHFAVVLPDVQSADAAARYLEQSRKSFPDEPFMANGSVVRVISKVGLAMFPDDGTDAETLFNHAEAALKKGKKSGERYVFYSQEMTDLVAARLALEGELAHALENNEFVLHYQPKVNVATRRVTGVEALIRWRHPGGRLVAPAEFIPMLEETGLIHGVGKWSILQALLEGRRLRQAGVPMLRIAVNVSPVQLRDADFVADVRKIIECSGGTAQDLELEITEGMIMEDFAHGSVTLQSLRDLGVSVAIDDFGTGYSSLGYLSKLPIDTLKIDRSFIDGMSDSPEGLALVSTIITLGHALKMKVVAEGVETQEQSRLLGQLGCDEMQGYLYCKPLPRAELEAMLVPAGAVG